MQAFKASVGAVKDKAASSTAGGGGDEVPEKYEWEL